MSDRDQLYTTNILLNTLSVDDFASLNPHRVGEELSPGQVLVTPDEPVNQVYFLEDRVASIMSSTAADGRTEVGLLYPSGGSSDYPQVVADVIPAVAKRYPPWNQV